MEVGVERGEPGAGSHAAAVAPPRQGVERVRAAMEAPSEIEHLDLPPARLMRGRSEGHDPMPRGEPEDRLNGLVIPAPDVPPRRVTPEPTSREFGRNDRR